MELRIFTPRQKQYTVKADSITLPGGLGELTILPGHTSLMSTLDVGVLKYADGKESGSVAVNRGFVEVDRETVTVLTETCESAKEIDTTRARDALQRAEKRLVEATHDGGINVDRAQYAMKRALARLGAVETARG